MRGIAGKFTAVIEQCLDVVANLCLLCQTRARNEELDKSAAIDGSAST